jgi:hypothetical protein
VVSLAADQAMTQPNNLGNMYANGQGVARDFAGREVVSPSRRAKGLHCPEQPRQYVRERSGRGAGFAEAAKWYRLRRPRR